MMIKRTFITILCAATLMGTLSGCYFLPDEEEVLEAPTVKASEVTYTTVTVKKKDIVKKLTNTGTIMSKSTTDLSFDDQGGKIKKLHVKAGDIVEKGDLICELDVGDLDYEITDKELKIKQAQLNVTITAEQGGSQSEVDNAQVNVDILKNELEALKKELQKSKLYTSVSGTVSSITEKMVGGEVTSGEKIATIVDKNSLYLSFEPSDISKFKVGQKITITYNRKNYSGEIFATPSSIPKNSTVKFEEGKVYAQFTGDVPTDAIGNVADAVLVLDSKKDVIVVAKKLVKTVNDKRIVYVLNEDNEKEAREVEVGLETGSESEIVSGLKEGEQVIVR